MTGQRAYLLRPDTTGPLAERVSWDGTLPVLQEFVGGGYVEHVRIGRETSMWVNEDGRARQLQINPMATQIYMAGLGGGSVILGPVLITGQQLDAEGGMDTADVGLEAEQLLAAHGIRVEGSWD